MNRIPAPPTALDCFTVRFASAVYRVRFRTLLRYWELAHKFQTLDPRPYSASAPAMSPATLERAAQAVMSLADEAA